MKRFKNFAGCLLTASILIFGLALASGCSNSTNDTNGDDDNVQTDGDDETTETAETTDNAETNSDLAFGACNTADDCATYAQCKKNSNDVKGCVCLSGICAPNPLKENEIYWENYVYDKEENKKEGTFDLCSSNPAKCSNDTVFNASCKDENFEEVTGTPTLTNVNGRIKVFGLKGPCNRLRVYIFYQFDSDGKLVNFKDHSAANKNMLTFNEEWPGSPDDQTGECPVFLKNVPTGRWLVAKATDNGGEFMDTYQYNVFIKPADAVTADGKGFNMEFNAVSVSSYQLVPVTAGLPGGIPDNQGAIAGTIKDCNGNLVRYATFGATGRTKAVAYFNSNVSDLLPFSGMLSTNKDGTFSSLGADEGEYEAVAAIKINGTVTQSKVIKYRIYAKSILIIPFRLANPMNYPQKEY